MYICIYTHTHTKAVKTVLSSACCLMFILVVRSLPKEETSLIKTELVMTMCAY